MCFLYIRLRQPGVMPYHFQVFVAENHLQLKQATTGAEISDCKGVPEPVWVDVRDPGAFGCTLEHFQDCITVKLAIAFCGKYKIIRMEFSTFGVILPDRLACAIAEWYEALFGSFTHDESAILFQVQILDLQIAELGNTAAIIQEEKNHGCIALRFRQPVAAGFLPWA